MYEGVLIVESLKVGAELAGIPLVVGKVSRYGVSGASADQPGVWSVLEFGVEDGRGDESARAEAQAFGQTLRIPEQQLDWTT